MNHQSDNKECDTFKLRENPKAEEYHLSNRKDDEEERVMSFLILPINKLLKSHKVEKKDVVVEIYKISCSMSNKCYIGQAVSHKLHYTVYRRHGSKGRMNEHISEAFSKKKRQSRALNNSIRKYGRESFSIELICICKKDDADELEKYYIKKYNTLAPSGYNLNEGGCRAKNTDETKKQISKTIMNLQIENKFKRFEDTIFPDDFDVDSRIFPLKRFGEQYGWYFLYDRKKVDFGGVQETLHQSKQRLYDFIEQLIERKR